jgi:hypothetical protein
MSTLAMNHQMRSEDSDRTAIVTVITEDHLPFARSMLQMAGDHGWEGQRFVVLVGAFPDRADLPSDCEVLPWSALLSQQERDHFQQRYTIAEICCALKPFAMDHLLSNGVERTHYLDSDIGVFGSLEALDISLQTCSIQLTPHYFEDPPLDGRLPDQLTLIRAGVFNAGYLGVRSTSVGHCFLHWWAEKVRKFGYVAPYLGMHGDQRWLDLVPAKFAEVKILREKGTNVGYWNLHERQLEFDGRSYVVDDRTLVFFHFSGFDPGTPGVLSEFQDRHSVSEGGSLSKLTEEYARTVIANGYGTEGRKSPGKRRLSGLERVRDKLIRWTAPRS